MHHDQEAEERPRGSGVLFGCLGVALVVILAGGGGLWWWWSSSFLQDPEEVAALLEEILPGARVPDGYTGQMGIDAFGQKMVFLGGESPSDEEQRDAAFIMVSAMAVDSEEGAEERFRRAVAEQVGAQDGEVEELGTEAIQVGGAEVVFQKNRVDGKGENPVLLQYVGVLPVREGRVTTIMIMGPSNHFDRKGMDAFLSSVAPLGGPPSSAPRKR